MSYKIKHLEIIQDTIKRMAGNSFQLRGWTITLVSAIIALLAKENNYTYLILAVIPIIAFGLLDAYYLRQEKLFRDLFNDVRIKEESEIDFCMDTNKYKDSTDNILKIFISKTIRTYYGGLFIMTLAVIILIA